MRKIALIFLVCYGLLSNLVAQSIAGYTSGAAVFCDSLNSGFISLNSFVGNVLKWQYSENNTLWKDIANNTSTQSYNHLTKTTSFRAIVKNAIFPEDTSSVCTISVQVKGLTGTISGGGKFCDKSINSTVQLLNYSGEVLHWLNSVNNGQSWSIINSNLKSLSIGTLSTTILYKAVIQQYAFCPTDTTPLVKFDIVAKSKAGFISGADTFCPGTQNISLLLTNYLGQIKDWEHSLNNGVTWSSLSLKDSIKHKINQPASQELFRVRVANDICTEDTSAVVFVGLFTAPVVNAGPDKQITRFETTTLEASGTGTVVWIPDETIPLFNILRPSVSPLNTTTYTVILTDLHGCTSSDSVRVSVIVPLPTVISPNGDGTNDYFEVDKIQLFPQSSLTVLNRWGAIVYKKSPYNNEWNGTSDSNGKLPDDTYYYILDYGDGSKPVTNYILIKR